jgi:hypothetical protein
MCPHLCSGDKGRHLQNRINVGNSINEYLKKNNRKK